MGISHLSPAGAWTSFAPDDAGPILREEDALMPDDGSGANRAGPTGCISLWSPPDIPDRMPACPIRRDGVFPAVPGRTTAIDARAGPAAGQDGPDPGRAGPSRSLCGRLISRTTCNPHGARGMFPLLVAMKAREPR